MVVVEIQLQMDWCSAYNGFDIQDKRGEVAGVCWESSVMAMSSLIRRKQLERQAEGYLELGMPRHALEALDRVGGTNSLGSRGLFLRGEALRELHRYQEALGPLEKAAEAAPDAIEIWMSLGWCYKRVGRIDRAVEAMERGLEAEPDRPVLHYNLACYLSLAGRKARALVHLARAFELDASFRLLADREPDFDPIRADPEFQALLALGV